MTSTRAPSRRSLRRPIPPLIFLLVLALLALGVWWQVLQRDEERIAAAKPPCLSLSPGAPPIDPASVQLRVYNASRTEGLAMAVGAELSSRGLQVVGVANDPVDRDVQGVGEIRFGPAGVAQAIFIAANFPELLRVPDTRSDPVVDVAIGPGYTGLLPAEQVPAAYAAMQSAAVTSAANC